ncbi:MAG TPA: hypothetical protein VEC18_03995 [Myxococcota bacterium]|nr:hypothetical protein [Myxococcota bacterium]
MRSQRRQVTSGAAQRAPRGGIDLPFLIVSTLTAFFATLFATLLVLRGDDRGAAESATAPAAPLDATAGGAPITAPVDAAPPAIDPGTSWSVAPAREADTLGEPADAVEPALRERLEQLGVRCAEGADCDPN